MNSEAFEGVVAALKAGMAAVFPTDTVYGIGVAVEHADSAQPVYEIKQREAGKPIAWLVGGADDLLRYGEDVSPRALELARTHWPGALTIIVKASDAVPPAFRAASGTIALRMPASEIALALVREAGPLATSSANPSGKPSPSVFADIDEALLGRVAALADDAQVRSGVASTVIDCTQGKIVIVRQGDCHV